MNILKIILPMGLLGFLFVFIVKKLEKSEKIKGKNQNYKNKQNYLAEGMTIGMSDKCQTKIKCGAAQSDDTADKNCKNYPFDRHQCTVCIVFDFMFYDIVHNSSPHNPFSSY